MNLIDLNLLKKQCRKFCEPASLIAYQWSQSGLAEFAPMEPPWHTRRRIYTDENAKVVAAPWGTELHSTCCRASYFAQYFVSFFYAPWATAGTWGRRRPCSPRSPAWPPAHGPSSEREIKGTVSRYFHLLIFSYQSTLPSPLHNSMAKKNLQICLNPKQWHSVLTTLAVKVVIYIPQDMGYNS